MNSIEQARQYLADEGKTLWSDKDIRPMVAGLLSEIKALKSWQSKPIEERTIPGLKWMMWDSPLNVRMADIREEGPSLLQRIKNWWRTL